MFYVWIKAIHVISVISWMAGLLYLPRLFVYHSQVAPDSDQAKLFVTMERKLMNMITMPAAILTWIMGLILISQYGDIRHAGWLHGKIFLVVLMTIYMFAAERWRRDLAAGTNKRSQRFFRMVNEIPAVLMVMIVILVIVKPF